MGGQVVGISVSGLMVRPALLFFVAPVWVRCSLGLVGLTGCVFGLLSGCWLGCCSSGASLLSLLLVGS